VAATVVGNAAPVDRNSRPVQEHQSDIAQRTGRPTPSGSVLSRSVFLKIISGYFVSTHNIHIVLFLLISISWVPQAADRLPAEISTRLP